MITIMKDSFFTFLDEIPHQNHTFSAEQMIVDMDDAVSRLYTVTSGMVHLVRFREDGGVAVLQRAGEGAILAEASVFSGRYHCAAMAVQACALRSYPLKAVRNLLETKPAASQAYALHLAAEVRSARKRAEILALKTVSERLTAWLTWNQGQMPERGRLGPRGRRDRRKPRSPLPRTRQTPLTPVNFHKILHPLTSR